MILQDNKDARPSRRDEHKLGAAWEIAFVIFCVLIAEWAILPIFGRNLLIGLVPVGLAFAFMFRSHRLHGEKAREIGWRVDNFGQALGLLILPMLLGSVLLVFCGWLRSGGSGGVNPGRLRFGWSILPALVWLFLWGLLQQYALQGFINRRAQKLWGRGRWSILFVALIFAFLHLPNLWLTLATFVGGLLWAAVYQRAPNLFALALSHCLMTVALVSTIPNTLLHGMKVGYNYFS